MSYLFCVKTTVQRFVGLLKLKDQLFIPTFTAVRHSRYDRHYLEPTFRPEDFAEEINSEDPRRFSPIKAATPEQTSSLTYDPLVAFFIRKITREGNKRRARLIMDKTFEAIKFIQLEKYHKAETEEQRSIVEINPRTIFHAAVENCKPLLITQRVKRGGNVYPVPIPVKPNYARHLAVKWLVESAEEKGRSVRVWDQLARELIEAYRNEGKSIKKKHELHKLCEANRAYAHYRW